jgi:hypothetical protein
MERNFWIKKIPVAVLAFGVVMAATAFQTKPSKTQQTLVDTVPDRSKKIKDIDEALEELERSKLEVDRSLKEVDFAKIEKEIAEATKNIHINSEEMKMQIEKAMKQVDAAKIQAEVQMALKEVDAEKMKAQMDKAMKDVDFEKMKAEIQASVAKIDWDKMNKELEKVKEIDFTKIEADLKKMKPEIEKSMKGAHENIEKAKVELNAYKSFIDGLEKDGLINKKENYSIEYKSGELTINGKKQPAEVVTKYSSFLKGHKDFTIKKDADDFNIDND